MHYSTRVLFAVGAAIAMIGAIGVGIVAVQAAPAVAKTAKNPFAITVGKQALKNGSVVVAKVVTPEAGWIVIHAAQNGQPGPVIGHAAVKKGATLNLRVKLTKPGEATAKLFAMLHHDKGIKKKYEFPGPDAPMTYNKKVVMNNFMITNAPAKKASAPAAGGNTAGSGDHGPASGAGAAATDNSASGGSAGATGGTTTDTGSGAGGNSGTGAAAATPAVTVKEFAITAKRFTFEPATITVTKGDKVKLAIKSQDTTHGFSLSDFGINKTIPPNETVTVEFTADKAGTFSFFCSVFCGGGHGDMAGKLVVNP